MVQEPNVELYPEQAIKSVLKQIKELKAEFELLKKALHKADVSGEDCRYTMTYIQPCQIDCRVTSCKFNNGAGKCDNISPAITLNENSTYVCWTKADL